MGLCACVCVRARLCVCACERARVRPLHREEWAGIWMFLAADAHTHTFTLKDLTLSQLKGDEQPAGAFGSLIP